MKLKSLKNFMTKTNKIIMSEFLGYVRLTVKSLIIPGLLTP